MNTARLLTLSAGLALSGAATGTVWAQDRTTELPEKVLRLQEQDPAGLIMTFTTLKDCRFTQIKKNIRLKFNSCKLLENCLFSGEIHKALFWYSNLKNCTFEGLLYDCSFYGAEKTGDLRKGEIIPPEKGREIGRASCRERV